MSVTGSGAAAVLVHEGPEAALVGLDPVLSQERRRHLADALLQGTLEALRTSRMVDPVLVAASDRRAREAAQAAGARPVPADGPEGAVHASLREVKAVGATVLALLSSSLPLLRAEDVAFLVGRALRGPVAVLVPEPDAPRTSLAVVHPWEAFTLAPGRDPQAYLEEAERRCVSTEVHRLPAGRTLRGPGDLVAVYQSERPSPAKELLKAWDGALLKRLGEASP